MDSLVNNHYRSEQSLVNYESRPFLTFLNSQLTIINSTINQQLIIGELTFNWATINFWFTNKYLTKQWFILTGTPKQHSSQNRHGFDQNGPGHWLIHPGRITHMRVEATHPIRITVKFIKHKHDDNQKMTFVQRPNMAGGPGTSPSKKTLKCTVNCCPCQLSQLPLPIIPVAINPIGKGTALNTVWHQWFRQSVSTGSFFQGSKYAKTPTVIKHPILNHNQPTDLNQC